MFPTQLIFKSETPQFRHFKRNNCLPLPRRRTPANMNFLLWRGGVVRNIQPQDTIPFHETGQILPPFPRQPPAQVAFLGPYGVSISFREFRKDRSRGGPITALFIDTYKETALSVIENLTKNKSFAGEVTLGAGEEKIQSLE